MSGKSFKKYYSFIFLVFILYVSCSRSNTQENLPKPERIAGIFGGMGPEATANFYYELVRLTPAEKDQDHIPTLIYSLPQVPDRNRSIRTNDMSIVPYLKEAVTRLEKAGASFICIPCNTVHHFYDYMQKAVSIPILHMIRETVKEVKNSYPDIKDIGLLATTGTIESKVYEKEFIADGFNVIIPDEDIEEEKVMKAIYGIKSGVDKKINEQLLAEAAENVISKGAKIIVLGCTEIPLAFNKNRVDIPVVNATEILALAAIKMYNEL